MFVWNVLLSLYKRSENMYAAKLSNKADRMSDDLRGKVEKIVGKEVVAEANVRPSTASYRCDQCFKGEVELPEGQKLRACCSCSAS